MVKYDGDVHYCSQNVFFHPTNGAQQCQKVVVLMKMDVKRGTSLVLHEKLLLKYWVLLSL